MGEGKEEKKDEKGKDKIEEKNKEEGEVINAIYKVNLHCQECGSKIKKHLMRSQGVQNVDIDIEKGEIKAKGKLDPLKILKLIEKKSNKKKVELISPKVKPKETITTTTNNKTKEMKDPIIRNISMKVHMHCDKCEADLKQKLMKHKGIFEVKTNMKTQNLMVNGTIEVEKLLSFMRKKVHKNAEVIYIKEEKKEEKKEKGKEEGKKKDDNKGGESTKEKEEKSSETSKEKEENVPYIIHYVYAPQIFSDENPNSCSIL
ncbi:PREDICTED: heavy metal-associated isoprenylated plant protein 4 [Lupinus angustifolius]|uniref:heavy metal-associated isoprenylated plant protein 4 n=1 Tax=Lupinus angustifolius TaxID=3871 RepID=UPI00092EA36A|nr:PREDICTED: heavy metal-associated isoprenylated plant protein 4 [Lupinus angustifolius]